MIEKYGDISIVNRLSVDDSNYDTISLSRKESSEILFGLAHFPIKLQRNVYLMFPMKSELTAQTKNYFLTEVMR